MSAIAAPLVAAAVLVVPRPAASQPATTRVSVGPGGVQAFNPSTFPAISADGRFVAFQSDANNLVTGDTNGTTDVFVHDRQTGTTTRVSVGPGGVQANGFSESAALSADGRWVAFVSRATNLVTGDTLAQAEVFVRDRETGVTTRVSVGPGGAQGNHHSQNPAISADGRWVAFSSFASNLVPGDTNDTTDVFVHDRITAATTRVSLASTGEQGNNQSVFPALSADGRWVAFTSWAFNLVPDDTNGFADTFVHDRQTGVTTRVSVGSGGVEGNSLSSVAHAPSISADGRLVAFGSNASNLVSGDSGNQADVFVHDRQSGTTTRASVGMGGSESDGSSDYGTALSADGRWVAFASSATNLVAGVDSGIQAVYVYDRQTSTTTVAGVATDGTNGNNSSWRPAISVDGRVVTFESFASNLVAGDTNGWSDVFVRDRGDPGCSVTLAPTIVSAPAGGTTGTVTVLTAAGCAWTAASNDPSWLTMIGGSSGTGPGAVSYGVAAQTGGPRSGTMTIGGQTFTVNQASTDGDSDGLPPDWETQFGLDPSSAAGHDGAAGDPDGDGVSNLQEYQRGTHPRGFYRRYLAEGALNAFFDTRLALLNVGTEPARVLLRFLQPGGGTLPLFDLLPSGRRRTLTRADLAGLSAPDFSTVVESDQRIVVERTMSWDGSGYGSHAESGVASPATVWYLAEGSTSGDFALFYLLQNPNPTATIATVRYLRPFGQPPIERTYALAPTSRTTIPVDDQGTELGSTDVSAVVTAPQPIIVERAMYRSRPGQAFAAGHGSAGVTAPAASWFLAEGATGPFFDLFILLANPNPQAAQVTVDYLLSSGATHTKSYSVPANGRFTIWVDDEQIPAGSGLRPLDNVAVSSTITATNGVPILVERTMWWPSPALSAAFWTEAHNSPGATAPATRWALAEGEVGGPQSAETYILIANTSAVAGDARVRLHFEDGTTADRTFALRATSRTTVAVSAAFPAAAGRRFGAVVESLGPARAPIVVERAMYTSPGGVTWAAGTNALATPVP